jgi:hypothetical protein
MYLPFEIIDIIYHLSNIDTQLVFNKLCPINSFLFKKINIDKNLYHLLSNFCKIHINRYNHIKSLKFNLTSHILLQNL